MFGVNETMVLDFELVNSYQVPMSEFAAGLTRHDLHALTNYSVDQLIKLVERCRDEEIVYVPHDPEAYDGYAAKFRPEEAEIGWTIGHNVVHAAASAEEYAFTAAELARGVPYHGRSRYERPWQSVTTVETCIHWLEQSRRMRLATLEVWPDRPDLENGVTPWRQSGWVNAIGLFTWGLAHDDSHRRQIGKILAQLERG